MLCGWHHLFPNGMLHLEKIDPTICFTRM
ncbi:hypothetical protein IFM89_022882 [Coptis chinensis]|uniref:Uncharacterized protein n=1 Tax=Coptis chinensis TaxID=261450 RepID=A0A835H814_9MAGN|nr:hypothetical protein IFM89_022882 [Coptis chinensis]